MSKRADRAVALADVAAAVGLSELEGGWLMVTLRPSGGWDVELGTDGVNSTETASYDVEGTWRGGSGGFAAIEAALFGAAKEL